VIYETRPLEQANEALEDLKTSRVSGRVVLIP
jgi:D-arabinose 1-dehydrogenase-like Zn-dependent alcohol dehydrogenase